MCINSTRRQHFQTRRITDRGGRRISNEQYTTTAEGEET